MKKFSDLSPQEQFSRLCEVYRNVSASIEDHCYGWYFLPPFTSHQIAYLVFSDALLDAAPFTLAVYFPDYTVLVLDEKNSQ
jgi:hypothetical protein